MHKAFYRLYGWIGRVTRWVERSFTPAGWLVLGALVLTGVFGVDTTQSTAYRLFAFLLVLVTLALAGARLRRGRFAVERALPRLASAGEPFEVRLRVTNLDGRIAQAITVMDEPAEPSPSLAQFRAAIPVPTWRRWQRLLESRRAVRVASAPVARIEAGATLEVRLAGRALRRGRAHFGAVRLGLDEPLGLARGIISVPVEHNLTVLPRRYALPALAMPGGRRYQKGGVSLANSVGDSEEFIGLRDYRPGDSLQRVHWKSFARTGRPVVRETQDEYFERHVLLLDTFATPGKSDAFEEAVSVATSFTCTIDTQECLLDLMFAGLETYTYTAGRGQLQAGSLLEVLAGVVPCDGRPFSDLAQAVLGKAGGLTGCICVLVGWDRARAELVEALRARGVALRVLCVARERPSDLPAWATLLVPGRVGEGLAGLR
jgi:uncharacterized protein (DUF58 family)